MPRKLFAMVQNSDCSLQMPRMSTTWPIDFHASSVPHPGHPLRCHVYHACFMHVWIMHSHDAIFFLAWPCNRAINVVPVSARRLHPDTNHDNTTWHGKNNTVCMPSLTLACILIGQFKKIRDVIDQWWPCLYLEHDKTLHALVLLRWFGLKFHFSTSTVIREDLIGCVFWKDTRRTVLACIMDEIRSHLIVVFGQ